MVKYVKNKLGSQQKNELRLFKTCEPKKTKKVGTKSSLFEPTVEQLTSDLIQGIIGCMESYGAAHFFDDDMHNIIGDRTVEVCIKKNVGIYGTVLCEICVTENKKKNKPKRVYYNDSSKWPCWILSNFSKHLKTVHKLKPHREPKINLELKNLMI